MIKNHKFFLPFLYLIFSFFTIFIFNTFFTEHDILKPISEVQNICNSINNSCISEIDLNSPEINKLNPIINITIKHNIIFLYLIQFSLLLLLLFSFFKISKDIKTQTIVNNKLLVLFSLFSSYKIIYLYSNNILNIPFKIALIAILLNCSVFFLLFFLLKHITKNIYSSIILSVFTCFMFAYFQPIFNSNIINSDIFTFCSLLIFSLTIILFLNSEKTIKFLTPFSITLLILCILNASTKLVTNINFSQKHKIKSTQSIINTKNSQNRDIYIFILDMYAGKDTIKQLGFDNSTFINELKKRGFLVFENINSNYNKTSASLPSFLNFNYIDNLQYNIVSDSLNNAELFKLAKNNNYYIYYLNSWPSEHKIKKGLIDNTLSTIDQLNKQSLNLLFSQHIFNIFINKYFDISNKTKPLNNIFNYIDSAINSNIKNKLCLFHVMMPHWPYFYDEYENLKKDTEDIEIEKYHFKLNTKSYLDFLKFTNKKTISYIDKILNTNKTLKKEKPIIIIMGDHGIRHEYYNAKEKFNFNSLCKNPNFLKDHFNTFLAFYNPDTNYNNYENISSLVNFFRIFANDTFNTSFHILPDRKFYIYMDSQTTYLNKLNGKYIN